MFVDMIFTWLPFTCVVWVAATASSSLQPSWPPPIYDLLPYFARNFYSHRYPCSLQERECMKRGKLLYEADGECYSVGERGPCAEGRTFHAELQEGMRLGGHLIGTCESGCEDDSQAPFIATGECMTRNQVETEFCRSDWYLSPVKDAFGQWVCEWTELPCEPQGSSDRNEWKGERYSDPYNGLCYPPDIFSRIGGDNSTNPADPNNVVHPPNHPLLPYFADNSYVGREYPCTEAERECLQLGRVLHSDGRCYTIAEKPDDCDNLFLDWDEVMREQGILRTSCRESPTWAYSSEDPLSRVCRSAWGMDADADLFGRMVCKCDSSREPDTPLFTDSPASPGFCRAPDFNYPARAPSFDRALLLGFLVPCSEEEFACMLHGRVIVRGECHLLRRRGPCEEGEEVLLDRHALANARLEAVCKTRPCPVGSVLLPYNGRCYTHEQAIAVSHLKTTWSAPPLSELLQYFPDETFYYKRYACSNQERECIKRSTLLHKEDGQCYKVGSRGPCAAGKTFHADLQEAKRLGGHLRGTCEPVCEDDSQAPFVATGECLTRSQVESQFCRSEWYLIVAPEKDLFGQWVCEWSHLPCPPPEYMSDEETYVYMGNGGFTPIGTCDHPTFLLSQRPYNYTVPTDAFSPEAPANHPLLQVFANKSYVGREIPCTEEEKECMRYKRLLYTNGKCYEAGKYEGMCLMHVDYEIAKKTGKVKLTCTPEDRTPIVDNRALWKLRVCRVEWGMKFSQKDVFGRKSCRCMFNSPPSSATLVSPRPGFCRSPDLDHRVSQPVLDITLAAGFSLPCSEEEFACLRENRVLAQGACHALRTQGPCAEGQELVLDKQALAHASLKAVCKTHPCPEGSVLMPIDGQCLTHKQVESILCPNQEVALDEFGGWQCLSPYSDVEWTVNLSATIRQASSSTCTLNKNSKILNRRMY